MKAVIVCWDFDETLGYFRPLEFRFLGQAAPAGMPAPRLKPGIAGLLAGMPELKHVVTTAAMTRYAREVVAEQGLLRYFADVIGREDGLFPGEGKDYRVVGERFGLREDEMAQKLAIIGNDARADPDMRGRPILFIHDPKMVDQPAEPLGIVLRALSEEGAGNWQRGFERLHEGGGGGRERAGKLVLQQRVCASTDYWGDFARGLVYPVVNQPRLIES
jgi:hypothetical protein